MAGWSPLCSSVHQIEHILTHVHVQNRKGEEPQGITAAEMAAMFDLKIMPTLRAFYEPETPEFEARCKTFAQVIGLPAEEWTRVQLPAFISVDNDKRHPWMRQLLCAPRVPKAEIDQYLRACVREQLRVQVPEDTSFCVYTKPRSPTPEPGDPDLHRNILGHLTRLHRQDAERALSQQASGVARRSPSPEPVHDPHQVVQDALRAYREREGLDFVQQMMREKANKQPWWRCLLPQQFMPLCEISPDIHSPVEHMVRTQKAFVRRKMQAEDPMGSKLGQAVTFQKWILEGVQERGCGARGLHHISRSVEKLLCICQILAADEGQEVCVKYCFKDGGANRRGAKKEVWNMLGTGGKWIQDRKWS